MAYGTYPPPKRQTHAVKVFILTYRDWEGDETPISPHRTLNGAKAKAQACEHQAATEIEFRKPVTLKWKHNPELPAQHSAPDDGTGHYCIYEMELE